MSSNIARDRLQSASTPLASVDEAPVKHFHLKERSSIPSLLRGADAFTITRLESSSGLPERITKVSSVPALLVAVSLKSLAIKDCQFWVDDKPFPTPYVPSFRSNVIDLDAQPGCWVGNAFDYVLFHVPRKGLDDIAADLGVGPVETYRVSMLEEDLVLSQLTKSILPHIGRPGWPYPLALDHLNLILGAHLLQKYGGLRKPPTVSVGGLGAVAEAACDGVAERESVRSNTALSGGTGVRPFDQPLCQVIQGELRCLHSPMARAAPD